MQHAALTRMALPPRGGRFKMSTFSRPDARVKGSLTLAIYRAAHGIVSFCSRYLVPTVLCKVCSHSPQPCTRLKRYYNCHTTAIKHANCKLQQILLKQQVLWELM